MVQLARRISSTKTEGVISPESVQAFLFYSYHIFPVCGCLSFFLVLHPYIFGLMEYSNLKMISTFLIKVSC